MAPGKKPTKCFKRALFYKDWKRSLRLEEEVEYADIFHPDEPPRPWRVEIDRELANVDFGSTEFRWNEELQRFEGPT